MAEKALHENPLVPNAKLREMFVAMTEMRVLDEHLFGAKRGKKAVRKFDSVRGQEACRVSTTIGLEDGDLVSDDRTGVMMELMFGAKIGPVLERVQKLNSSAKKLSAEVAGDGSLRRLLPAIDDAEERLNLAMGSALSFKTLKRMNFIVAFVKSGELTGGGWRRVLKMAAQFELPILFVVLPGKDKKQGKAGDPIAKAKAAGLPGIPVDATDAVALYRVAQESIGRMRNGGGAVLIECTTYHNKGKAKVEADPLKQMREFLLGRKVGTEKWLDGAGESLRKRIAASTSVRAARKA